MNIRVFIHDYQAARKAAKGNLPVLKFHSGEQKVLLPHGQLVNISTMKKGKAVSGKQERRARIKRHRMQREAISTP